MAYLPLPAILLVSYFVVIWTTGLQLETNVATFHLVSGANLTLTVSQIFIITGLFFSFIESIKATRTTTASVIDHSLSMLVFIAFLVCFLIVKEAGTSTFLILTIVSLVDVLMGFNISISTARRDIGIQS